MSANEPQNSSAANQDQSDAFDRVIAPLNRQAFLSEFWDKSFLRVVGQKGKFQYLLPWKELNTILEQCRLDAPRVRLVRDGKAIDPDLFLGTNLSRAKFKPVGLMNCLAEGATLIIDSVDELSPGVADLAETFQETLQSATFVNLYASWRTQKGFDLHWDDQDTMILQLSGRKHWKVYSPTRIYPLRDDIESTPKPTGAPEWDGILEEGDMIYMPRGYWHVAFPLDEPSLHLTVTIVPAEGTDFLRWLVHELKRYPEVRMNVPHLASEAELQRYVARLKELLMQSFSDDVLGNFMAHRSATIPGRPRIRLPHGPMESRAPLTMDTSVRLASSRRIAFSNPSANGTIGFVVAGTRGECARELVPALKQLNSTIGRSIADLCAELPDQNSSSKLMILLTALAMRGVLQIEARVTT